jgi:hypothetical protein
MWADSVLIVTVSANGDTIAWLGTHHRGRLAGSYRIIGGQWIGQWGEWFLEQTRGPALMRPTFANRPFPDSIDIAALLGLSSADTKLAVERKAKPAESNAAREKADTPRNSSSSEFGVATGGRRGVLPGSKTSESSGQGTLADASQPFVIGGDDREAMEAACRPTKTALGPGAYNNCLITAVEKLRQHPVPSFVGLDAGDRDGIEAACHPAREALGPGDYNQCLENAINELRRNPSPASDGIGDVDRRVIEAACRPARTALGPGAYNQCVANAITQLRQNPTPSFVGIADDDQRAIDGACRPTRTALGPGAFNQCLANAVTELRQNRAPDFTGVSAADRQSIEAACRPSRIALGPGAYNKCMANAIRELVRSRPPGSQLLAPRR